MDKNQDYKQENISRICEDITTALANLTQLKSIIKDGKFDLDENRTNILQSFDKTIQILYTAENECKNLVKKWKK